jgi:hypothetical protein
MQGPQPAAGGTAAKSTGGAPIQGPEGAPQVVAPPGAASVRLPASNDEYRAVVARRTELTSQLRGLEGRAGSLVENMKEAPDEARQLLAERLKVVNDRIVQIESELALAGWQLSNTPPAYISVPSTQVPRSYSVLDSRQITGIASLGIIFILAPIALAIALRLWRRGFRGPGPSRDVEGAQRMKRMEHSIDAMAIEVERISEGQRFLTQIFATEQRQPALQHGVELPVSGRDRAPRTDQGG